jgi:hypothetical protein
MAPVAFSSSSLLSASLQRLLRQVRHDRPTNLGSAANFGAADSVHRFGVQRMNTMDRWTWIFAATGLVALALLTVGR